MKKELVSGFTLVEVLITVGIIGVVAALTIPTIIQNSNNRKFASQFKKTLSTLSQAAIMSQAQYDSDYSSLNTTSSSENCAEESLAKSNLTMCGLFNSTLSGHTFLGMYGTAKGANARSIYTVAKNALPDAALSTENTMIFGLADGTIIGFNKNATNCGVMPGTPMTAEILNGALANCVGFIDVNGPNPPNKEVTCKDADSTALNPSATCAANSAVGDVFPVVFHNGTVEPASNAAKAILGGSSNAQASAPPSMPCIFDYEASNGCLTNTVYDYAPMSYNECMQNKEALGLDYCYGENNPTKAVDYYAGAARACGGKQNLPSQADLVAFASEIYGVSIPFDGGGGVHSSATDETIVEAAERFGISALPNGTNRHAIVLYMNEESSATHSSCLYMDKNGKCTGGYVCNRYDYCGNRSWNWLSGVLCVKHGE